MTAQLTQKAVGDAFFEDLFLAYLRKTFAFQKLTFLRNLVKYSNFMGGVLPQNAVSTHSYMLFVLFTGNTGLAERKWPAFPQYRKFLRGGRCGLPDRLWSGELRACSFVPAVFASSRGPE